MSDQNRFLVTFFSLNTSSTVVGGAPSEITKIRPFFLEKFELEFLPEDPAEKSTPQSNLVSAMVYSFGLRSVWRWNGESLVAHDAW